MANESIPEGPAPVLDAGSRNAILAAVAGIKPGKKLEAATQIQETTTTLDPSILSTAPKKFVADPPKAAVTESTTSTTPVCKGCGHKIWSDGTEWQHTGKAHNDNCDCREAIPGGAAAPGKASEGKQKFTADTPFEVLLEACTESHLAVKAADEEVAAVNDEVRKQVIEHINKPDDMRILKDWRF